jgi:Transposase DDE domain
MLRSPHPRKGETIYLILDDSKKAKRGRTMDAVAKMQDPPTATYILGHQDACAILVCRDHGIPYGIRLYVKQAPCPALGLPFRKTAELAAQLLREFKVPTGVKVVVLFDAYYRCPTVVKACREQRFHFASTLKSNRSLFKQGWKLKDGHDGRNLFRRRRAGTLAFSKPYGPVHYRLEDAGWLEVSTLGPLHVVFSRKGTAKTVLGLVTDAPTLSAPDVIRTYEKRWAIEQWLKDTKQLPGAWPRPESLVLGGSHTPASGLLRLRPPDPPAYRAPRCTRPTNTCQGCCPLDRHSAGSAPESALGGLARLPEREAS